MSEETINLRTAWKHALFVCRSGMGQFLGLGPVQVRLIVDYTKSLRAQLAAEREKVAAEHEMFLTAHRDNMKGALLLAAEREKREAAERERDMAFRVADNHKADTANAVRIGCENITAREAAEARVKELEADLLTKFEIEARVAALSVALAKAKEGLSDISEGPNTQAMCHLSKEAFYNVIADYCQDRASTALLEIEKEMGV